MRWYFAQAARLQNVQPIISACGDDCAVCPRYLAQTEQELREVAEFWHKVGWRAQVVPPQQMRCEGCGSRPECSYGLLPCLRQKGAERCSKCESFPCAKVEAALANSQSKKQRCREACANSAEFALLERAFYRKEENI